MKGSEPKGRRPQNAGGELGSDHIIGLPDIRTNTCKGIDRVENWPESGVLSSMQQYSRCSLPDKAYLSYIPSSPCAVSTTGCCRV